MSGQRASSRPASAVLGDLVAELEVIFTDLDALGRGLIDLAAPATVPGLVPGVVPGDAVGGDATGVAGVAGMLFRDDLATLRPEIFKILDSRRDLVAGAGLIMTPGVLRDEPRWLEWWWTNGGGTHEPLRINLDPAAPDFFDYTTADWYATPARTLGRRAAGPYVDYACTNQYSITLSTPVLLGDDLLGMAAADVTVASLERRVLPVLMAIPHPVILANGDGRVIAANSPRWAPGQRIALGGPSGTATAPRPPADEPTASPLRSWVLVEFDPV